MEDLAFSRASGSPEARGFSLRIARLDLERGESLGVIGPSGSGKSTLLDVLALLRRPDRAARFRFLEHDVAALWTSGDLGACVSLRARHIGVVLQTGGLLASLSVIDNVLLSPRLLGLDARAWVDEMLEHLGLDALRHRLPAALSIGQRQRVAIARALAHRPALILADEPTASLDAEQSEAAMRLLCSLTAHAGTGLIVVSHDEALLVRHGLALLRCDPHGSETTVGVVA
ncbi:MAG: ATP-binding cassette domain-containing protein [Alphaproteobacteria bacterium]|nr:ATP-binding cassette domain-containing protein [Alphaproteobacteria bacterium]